MALGSTTGVTEAVPVPQPLLDARDRVARDFGLPKDWLNSVAGTDMLWLGPPDGFVERLTTHQYGPSLTIRWASRYDQIHFKLHATVDRGGGKHFTDLVALEPTEDELVAAALWTRTHDPSEGFLMILRDVFTHFEIDHGRLAP